MLADDLKVPMILFLRQAKIKSQTEVTEFFPTGGPYEAFAGKDASRALATFAVDAATDKYDDLSDLNSTEMSSIKEWEEQFKGEIHVFNVFSLL